MNNTNNENVNVNNGTNSENVTPINNTQQEPISQQQSVTQTTTPSTSPQEVAPIEVAPMEATPMDEQIISTYKKKSSNTILYILVILLIIFVLFMDNILEFVNKNIINVVPNNPNTSENLIDGYLKLEEKTGYIKVNNIKYYNIKKSNDTNIILNYESYKNSSNIDTEGIYIELYNSNKEILNRTLFNPSKIEKDVVRTFTFEVTNDVYTDAYYALVKTYNEDELKSEQKLICKYTINNDNIILNYTNTFEFINNSLNKYSVNKTFEYKNEDTDVLKYKESLNKEHTSLSKFNIEDEYTDTSLKYNIDLNNDIKDFKPLYKKDTIITIVKNKEELKKWKCE